MEYVTVTDLKHSKKLFEKLSHEKELVLTRDGRPGALILEVDGQNLEQTLLAVRRSFFSCAVSAVRHKALESEINPEDIEREIRAARSNRK